MKRSRLLAAVGLLSLVTCAAYSKSIQYDGKTQIGSGTATSISLAGTGAGCSGVLVENIDTLGCIPGISSVSFNTGDAGGFGGYTEIVSESGYTTFLWPASVEPAFDSSYNGAVAATDYVAAVITGAYTGACAASTNANCWSLEFDYASVTKPGGSLPVVTPLTSCPGGSSAASVSIVAGGVTTSYASASPCAINGTEMDFIGSKLTATFCTNGGTCGTPTTSGGGGVTPAPEIDPASATSALTLLAGCLAVLGGFTRASRGRAMARPSTRKARS